MDEQQKKIEDEIFKNENFILYQTLVSNFMEFQLRFVYQIKKIFDEDIFIIYLLVESCGKLIDFISFDHFIGCCIHTHTQFDNNSLIGKRVIFTKYGLKEDIK